MKSILLISIYMLWERIAFSSQITSKSKAFSSGSSWNVSPYGLETQGSHGDECMLHFSLLQWQHIVRRLNHFSGHGKNILSSASLMQYSQMELSKWACQRFYYEERFKKDERHQEDEEGKSCGWDLNGLWLDFLPWIWGAEWFWNNVPVSVAVASFSALSGLLLWK